MAEYNIPNLRNACRLLLYLGEQDGEKSVTELAEALQLPRTSALRIVKTLESEGFLQDKGTGFQLGGALAALGMKAAGNIDLRAAARPVLQALTSSSDETCHLAVWDQGRALIIEVSECSHPLSAASKPGTRAYVHASSTGKVLLAHLFIEELESVWAPQDRVSLTRNTTTNVEGLRAELAKVLKNGYALDDEEYHVGVRCVAAPVFFSDGRVCAGVGITASSARFTKRRVGELSKLVKQAAADISRLLGWKG